MAIEQQMPDASIKQEIPQDGSALPLERSPYLYIKTTAAKGIYVKTSNPYKLNLYPERS